MIKLKPYDYNVCRYCVSSMVNREGKTVMINIFQIIFLLFYLF